MISVDKDKVSISGTLKDVCVNIGCVVSATLKAMPKDLDNNSKDYASFMFRALIFRIMQKAEEAGLDMEITDADMKIFGEAYSDSESHDNDEKDDPDIKACKIPADSDAGKKIMELIGLINSSCFDDDDDDTEDDLPDFLF